MRKVLISLAAAASALAVAAPASAQSWGNLTPYHGPSYNYAPYSYGYGFNGMNFGRSMQARVQQLRNDIRNMQMRRIISYSEARSLDREANSLQNRIYRASRNGISPGEARSVENRIRRLESRMMAEARDWDSRPGQNYGRGYYGRR